MEEFEADYTSNGHKNWAKINKDIAYIRKALGNRSPPNLEQVRKIMEKRKLCTQIGMSESINSLEDHKKKQRKKNKAKSCSRIRQQTSGKASIVFEVQQVFFFVSGCFTYH